MSHLRVLLKELRAALSAGLVCALILGLFFSNFAQAAGIEAPRTHRVSAYAQCVLHLAHPAEKQTAPASDEHRTHGHKCPACCLAAALGSALIPPRVTNVTRPGLDRARIVAYFAASPREPTSLLFSAANGARAPPV